MIFRMLSSALECFPEHPSYMQMEFSGAAPGAVKRQGMN
jgi:hypothetical protein